MTNPPYILEHLEAVAEVMNRPNVYAFLHVPVQSGSNRVLDDMKREYTVEEFKYGRFLPYDHFTHEVPSFQAYRTVSEGERERRDINRHRYNLWISDRN